MARKPSIKPGKQPREKIQLSLPPATAKRLRIAAAELGVDMSELVADLIDSRFRGVHVRGLEGASPAAGQVGQVSDPNGQPTVTIPTVMNRISQIHRSATAPVDSALAGFSDDQP